MKNYKKEILSLLLVSTMLISTSGCGSKIKSKYDKTNGVSTYTGIVSYSDLNKLYIVEIKNIDDKTDYYLTYYKSKDLEWDKMIDLNSGVKIAYKDLNNQYVSTYGKFISTLPIKDLIIDNIGVKKSYQLDEIKSLYNSIIDDYDKLIEKNSINKILIKNKE